MRFCFIIEEQYRNESMPRIIVDQLLQRGHDVDLLEPGRTITCLSDLSKQDYDAYVLKTVSDGPGLSILEAAEAIGIPTINNPRSIRLVRDKAVATAFAQSHGLPVPLTYFVTHPRLLEQIPEQDYPLVIKPTNGSSCRGIYRVDSPSDLARLKIAETNTSFFLAQQYVKNIGFDIKLYVAGQEVYAIAKRSPLHPDVVVNKHLIPVSAELRKLALRVGKIFGLDIYGLDVVETTQGPVIVDINDFPSFGYVPQAVTLVSDYILQLTSQAELQRRDRLKRMQRRCRSMIEVALQRLSTSRAAHLIDERTFSSSHDVVQNELYADITLEESKSFR